MKEKYIQSVAEVVLFDHTDIIQTSGGEWPGNGWGDTNHDHGGPPGHTGNKPGWGNGGTPPGQNKK